MAGAVITDLGLRRRLAASLNAPLFLRLFSNDVPILSGSTLGDFNVATFPGYADLDLTGLWPAPVTDVVGRAWSAVYNQTWTRGAGVGTETIYGWLIYQDVLPDSALVCGKRFTVPRVINAPGQTIIESVIFYLLRG